uniref:Uricase oxidase n=1 Tax=Caudovirales sp. ctCpR1 TaxID=2825760 RepID=A0A8S5V8X1_9CAUD|nr:MAG TPA: uricase oxidase [Caudovirales sp. ctCpR1]
MRAGITNGAAIIESVPEICEISGRGSRSVNIIAFQNLHLLPLPL